MEYSELKLRRVSKFVLEVLPWALTCLIGLYLIGSAYLSAGAARTVAGL